MRRDEKRLRLYKDIACASIEACESIEAIDLAMRLLYQADPALRRKHSGQERRADRE